jgi:isopentenyl diphosphate isomerase/L-lactate dehydrogenase-like FMN-dependent dehydrogenase
MTRPDSSTDLVARNRRQFLRFLAASPLLAKAWAEEPAITSPEDAINVMDFEPVAHKNIPPAHWGYMSSGVDDDLTLKANLQGFKHFQLRPRRLVDVSKVDLKTEVFGSTWEMPLFICPVGGQKSFHPEGEIAVARAAKAKKTTQVLSTQTSTAVEDVAKALGTPPWYQLYMPAKWNDTEKLVKRVEDAGCPALLWTVDLLGGRNTETAERFRRMDTRDCTGCHTGPKGGRKNPPMFAGIQGGNPSDASWSWVDRLKKLSKMKLIIKGIETGEDAKLAMEHGADAILVSNHGGRATETLRSTVECLPEMVDAVAGRIPVFLDGGVRRGTDIYKALAVGARAVGIGRPYIYGLGAFGQPGVERVLDILRAELALIMRQCGTPSIAQINRAYVVRDGVRL